MHRYALRRQIYRPFWLHQTLDSCARQRNVLATVPDALHCGRHGEETLSRLLDATRYPYGKIYKIKRHRLNYIGLSEQQERTQSKGISLTVVDKRKFPSRELSILKRNVMVEPHLYLAFTEKEDAEHAFAQHICLCRNEDILMPEEFLEFSDEADFDKIEGFELLFCSEAEGFKVGHNRFAFGEAMYGELKIFGNPIRQPENYF